MEHSNDDNENETNREFKRLLCEKISANDQIWSIDSFDMQKFDEEPYINIIKEILGWLFSCKNQY